MAPMDADEYRRQIENEIADKRAAPGDLASALEDMRDTTAPLERRIDAAMTVNRLALGSEEAIDALLSIVGDDDEPPALRRVALDGLRVHRFSSTDLKARRADMTRAVRRAMESDDEDLRLDAIELLAAERDVDVQRQLIDGLRDESQSIVSARRSVELLGYDVKADHYGVLKEVVETSDDAEVKREAIRLLAADRSSMELIERVVRDKNENAAVRAAGSAALQSLAPETFEAVAQDVVSDQDEYDDIKVSMLSKLAYQTPRAPASDAFIAEVTRARDALEDDNPLKQAAQQYTERREA